MVIQQIHLIHIEQPPVGLGQQTRFKGAHPFAEGFFDVDRSAETILRGSKRQIHHRHLARFGRQRLALLLPLTHLAALQVRIRG